MNCPHSILNNGHCDSYCRRAECAFDDGDCEIPFWAKSNETEAQFPEKSIWYDTEGPYSDIKGKCALGCPYGWIGDGHCDKACYESEECQYDGLDCA